MVCDRMIPVVTSPGLLNERCGVPQKPFRNWRQTQPIHETQALCHALYARRTTINPDPVTFAPTICKSVADLMHSISKSHKTQIGEVVTWKNTKIRKCATWGACWWIKKATLKILNTILFRLFWLSWGLCLQPLLKSRWNKSDGDVRHPTFHVFKGSICLFIIFIDHDGVVLCSKQKRMAKELHPHFLLGAVKIADDLHQLYIPDVQIRFQGPLELLCGIKVGEIDNPLLIQNTCRWLFITFR